MSIAAILASKGSEVMTITADSPLRDAVELLGTHRIGALPVMDGDSVGGIISERDIVYCLKEYGAEVLNMPVSKAMSSPALTVTRDTDAVSYTHLTLPTN